MLLQVVGLSSCRADAGLPASAYELPCMPANGYQHTRWHSWPCKACAVEANTLHVSQRSSAYSMAQHGVEG